MSYNSFKMFYPAFFLKVNQRIQHKEPVFFCSAKIFDLKELLKKKECVQKLFLTQRQFSRGKGKMKWLINGNSQNEPALVGFILKGSLFRPQTF